MIRFPSNPSDDDPTDEQPTLEYDGTRTDELDEAYRMRVVAANENGSGTVDFDDRGQPRWKWITETDGAAQSCERTFDHLKALDNEALSIEEPAPDSSKSSPASGYDPYDTIRTPALKPRKRER